jgi:hypothetical protein
MQCPILLLIKAGWREGKALGNEESTALGGGHYYEKRKEVEQGLYRLVSEFLYEY